VTANSLNLPNTDGERRTAVLVLNAGSSSLKFAAFAVPQPSVDTVDAASSQPRTIVCGHVALRATEVELLVEDGTGELLEKSLRSPAAAGAFDHAAALVQLFSWLDANQHGLAWAAVGHRVVHGGAQFAAPVVIDSAVLRGLQALLPLAPLHQAQCLAAIPVVAARWPQVPQVACFDTAFHHTQPAVARAFALPRDLTDAGVRRYGFHGLSYNYIASQLPRVFADKAHASPGHGKVIVAHLGSGASLCAMVDGQSVASTMGFSVLDGLVMGTRCGTLDAGVVLYLQQHLGKTVEQVSHLLYEQSGLLGVSGISGDMQALLATTDARAAEAIDLFVYRVAGEIGALTAAMGGLDSLVFTGGIGENAPLLRERICAACGWLGAVIDKSANHIDLELIHAPASGIGLAVVPTDEALTIARHTVATLPHLFEPTTVH
jgi:acetate kinase